MKDVRFAYRADSGFRPIMSKKSFTEKAATNDKQTRKAERERRNWIRTVGEAAHPRLRFKSPVAAMLSIQVAHLRHQFSQGNGIGLKYSQPRQFCRFQ